MLLLENHECATTSTHFLRLFPCEFVLPDYSLGSLLSVSRKTDTHSPLPETLQYKFDSRLTVPPVEHLQPPSRDVRHLCQLRFQFRHFTLPQTQTPCLPLTTRPSYTRRPLLRPLFLSQIVHHHSLSGLEESGLRSTLPNTQCP